MIESLNSLVLGDRVLRLDMKRSARLSGSGDCFGCEDLFLEEALADELFQVPFEAPTMDSFVPLPS